MKNYRICFDYSAESALDAVIQMCSLFDGPDTKDIRFKWLVTDQESGETVTVDMSLNELEAIANQKLAE